MEAGGQLGRELVRSARSGQTTSGASLVGDAEFSGRSDLALRLRPEYSPRGRKRIGASADLQ